MGGDITGWSFYIMDGKLVYHYNWFDMERYQVVSEVDIPEGKVELKGHFINESQIPGGSASVTLYINGEQIGTGKIEKQVRGCFGVENLDAGVDALNPINKAYEHKQDGYRLDIA